MTSTQPDNGTDHENVMVVKPVSAAGQVYSLAAQVASLRANPGDSKAIGLASCSDPEEIKALAIEFATAMTRFVNGSVLLVHLNSEAPKKRKTSVVETPTLFGWSEVVDGQCNYREVVRRTTAERLNVLNYGMPKRSRKSATSVEESKITIESIEGTLSQLKQEYEFTIFQLPNVLQDVTALSLASALDGVVVVMDHRRSRMSQVRGFVEFLKNHHAHVVGVVMNRYRSFLPRFLQRRR